MSQQQTSPDQDDQLEQTKQNLVYLSKTIDKLQRKARKYTSKELQALREMVVKIQQCEREAIFSLSENVTYQEHRKQQMVLERKIIQIAGGSEKKRQFLADFEELRQIELDTIEVWKLVEMQIRVKLVFTSDQCGDDRHEIYKNLQHEHHHLKH